MTWLGQQARQGTWITKALSAALLISASQAHAVQAVDGLPQVLVNPTDLIATERGDPARMVLSLSRRPSATVTLVAYGDGECKVNPTKLVFQKRKWSRPQTLTVTAIPDAAPEGTHSCRPSIRLETEDRTFKAVAAELPTVSVQDDLVDRIAERLASILRKDFSSVLVGQQRALDGMISAALQRLKRGRYGLRCGETQAFDVDGTVEVKETRRGVRGTFGDEVHHCHSAQRRISAGSFALSTSDSLGRQSLLSYRQQREQQSQRKLRGFFLGGYGSETAVQKLGTGTVTGVGAQAGFYGADRFRKVLMLSYYAAAATGRHKYDLAFEQPGGSILAKGAYTYGAGLAGIAVSGQRAVGPTILHPKAGVHMAYGQVGDTKVHTERGSDESTGTLTIPDYKGLRSALELGVEYSRPAPHENGWSRSLWLAPKAQCLSDVLQGDLDCGSGLSVTYELAQYSSGTSYSVTVDAEADRKSRRRSIALAQVRGLGDNAGESRSYMTLDDRAKPVYGYELSLDF